MRGAATLAALAAAVALLIPTVRHLREEPPPPPPAIRLALIAPPGTELGSGDEPLDLAVSPDEREVVFVATARRRGTGVQPPAGSSQLWRRRLDAERAEAIPQTENARQPAWKQTGNVLSFFADGRLKLLNLRSGAIGDLGDAPMPSGATWLADGSLLFVPAPGPIRRQFQGRTTDATRLVPGDVAHQFPAAVGASQEFVYIAVRNDGRRIVRLNSSGTDRELGTTSAHALVAGPERDWLLVVRDTTLLADRLAADGTSLARLDVPVALDVGTTRSGRGLFAATSDVLVYANTTERARRIIWLDMQGAPVGTVADAGDYWQVRVAPDDSRLAVTARDPQLRSLDVLMIPVSTASPSLRLTTSLAADSDPVWSLDGREIAFRSMQRGHPEVLATPAAITAGNSEPSRRLTLDGEAPTDWRGDELLVQRRSNVGFDLIRVNLADGEAQPIAETPFNETDARWSPDGQLIAYVSDEPGQPDIYLTNRRGERQRVSLDGGTRPRWTADGRALLFLRGSTVMRVARTGGRFAAPEPLFDLPGIRDFDTSHRGDRIVALVPAQSEPVEAVSVVLNWRSLLRVSSR
jgi:hypothetical protein